MLKPIKISNRTEHETRNGKGRPYLDYRIAIVALAIVGVDLVSNLPRAGGQEPVEKRIGNEAFDPFGAAAPLEKAEILDGWLSLFDGETLYGWKAETDANWHVQDDQIRADRGSMGLIRTTSQFDDFELRLEFRSSKETNSGVFLRTSPQPENPADDCLELNIAPVQNPFPTGSLVYRVKAEVEIEPEQWNQYRAIADGNRLRVWVNDQRTIDYINPKPLGRGFIGLQFREGPIAFRNIVIKPRNQKLLFNNRDLDGWSTAQTMDSRLSVTPAGELRIENGPGQIESVTQFGDFIFSTLCKTNAPSLNSGVFFRCIPGELMNGYESQINNDFKNGDRHQPVDCGTGGIFRRQNARQIVANDQEWFAKTIIATGPHIAVWVNGYQVSDWTDQRKPDENPRKGQRLSAGTIIFQGHDSTTDILFDKIRAREMTNRRPKQD